MFLYYLIIPFIFKCSNKTDYDYEDLNCYHYNITIVPLVEKIQKGFTSNSVLWNVYLMQRIISI